MALQLNLQQVKSMAALGCHRHGYPHTLYVWEEQTRTNKNYTTGSASSRSYYNTLAKTPVREVVIFFCWDGIVGSFLKSHNRRKYSELLVYSKHVIAQTKQKHAH